MMKEIIITFFLLIFKIWATNCEVVDKQIGHFQVSNEMIRKLSTHVTRNSVKVSTNFQIIIMIDQFTAFH